MAYTYDPNGNTTQKTKAGLTTEFKYDIRNQLSEVQQGANVLGRYGFDYEGMRVLKLGDDGVRRYTYDQLSVVTEANQANTTVSKYDYGLDQLVRLDNTSEGRSFFHLDILGSTVSLTENVGSTRQSIFYDAWGDERDRIGASENNFTFTGHEKDGETGLIYAKARFYDPDAGRFLTQDSVLGDANRPPSLHRYYYVNQNPLAFIDPDGRAALDLVKGLAVGAGTAFVIVLATTAAVAVAPFAIPTSVVVGLAVTGLAVTTATVVQSTRQRDLLNNPISEEQADFQLGSALGGLGVAAGSGPIAGSMSAALRPLTPALATTTAMVVVEATTAVPALVPALPQAAGLVTAIALPTVLAMSSTGEGDGGGSSDDDADETSSSSSDTEGTQTPPPPRQSTGAESATNRLDLQKQLASEQQVGEVLGTNPERMAGQGVRRQIDDINRLVSEYGGEAADWAKVGSSNFKAADGTSFEVHAYENVRTGEVFEVKTKFQ